MFKRVGVLVMMLAGSLAVFSPAVAQANDRNDYRRYERHVDRREWRAQERWDRRAYRPYYYDRFGHPYCPR
jgi:hypothetical protein